MSTLTELQIAYVGNANKIEVRGLRAVSVQSGSPVNGATVVVTLVLSGTATEVTGAAFPVALTLVTSGSGSGEEVKGSRWEGTLSSSLSLSDGEYYQAQVTATAGTGYRGFWKVPIKGKIRES